MKIIADLPVLPHYLEAAVTLSLTLLELLVT